MRDRKAGENKEDSGREPPPKKKKNSSYEQDASFDADKRNSLCVGLKETVRTLEKGNLIAGVICLSTCPIELQTWLLGLVAVRRGIPFIGLHDVSPTLARLLNVTTVMALGFKKDASLHFPTLCSLLAEKSPPIDFPWLRAKHTMEPVSDDVISSIYDNCELQICSDSEGMGQNSKTEQDRTKEMYGGSSSTETNPTTSPCFTTEEERIASVAKRLSFSPIYQSAKIRRTPIVPKKSLKKDKRKYKT